MRFLSGVRSAHVTHLVRVPSLRASVYLAFTWLVVAGCSQAGSGLQEAKTFADGSLHGSVHGGQQPLAGSKIELYAVGSAGDGSAATSMLHQAVFTDSNGAFSITNDYTCPNDDPEVYVVATGGNPGLNSGTDNPNLALMTFLGPCNDLTSSTFISVNELTTVAAAEALAPYMTSYSNLGFGASDAAAFDAAVVEANELVNTSTGTAPGASLPPGYYGASLAIDTLGDLLAPCVNSSGGISGDGSICGDLFALGTPPGGTAPTDTVGAALNIAKNPAQNTVSLFDLIDANAPFQPTLNGPPSTWAVSILPYAATPTISPAGGNVAPGQSVTIGDSTTGATIYYTTNGATPTSSSTLYSGPIAISGSETISAVAIASGYASSPVAFSTYLVTSGALSISTTTCPSGTQYLVYSGCTILATGGTPPYTYAWTAVTDGSYAALPEGLSLNAASGAIAGTVYGQGGYGVQFSATDATGAVATRTIVFEMAGNSDTGGCSLFPSNSIFHTNISALPVDTSPAAPIPAVYATQPIRPFFGSGPTGNLPNGIPFVTIPYNQAFVPVSTTAYQSYFTSGPFPFYAPIEGTLNNAGGDRHVLVVQTSGAGGDCQLWEMWQGAYLGTGGWTDGSNAYWDISANAMLPQDNGSTDAAGLPIAPLLVNYDEVAAGAVTHPIRFTLNHMLNYYVWPATSHGGVGYCTGADGNHEIYQDNPPTSCTASGPAGEIYRLKASVATPAACSGMPQALTIIAGMRNYGIILADNGISGGLIGTPDSRWSDTQLACLSHLTLADFEPVNVSGIIAKPTLPLSSYQVIP